MVKCSWPVIKTSQTKLPREFHRTWDKSCLTAQGFLCPKSGQGCGAHTFWAISAGFQSANIQHWLLPRQPCVILHFHSIHYPAILESNLSPEQQHWQARAVTSAVFPSVKSFCFLLIVVFILKLFSVSGNASPLAEIQRFWVLWSTSTVVDNLNSFPPHKSEKCFYTILVLVCPSGKIHWRAKSES